MVYCCIYLSYPSVMLEREVSVLLLTLLFISLILNFANELSLQSVGGVVGSHRNWKKWSRLIDQMQTYIGQKKVQRGCNLCTTKVEEHGFKISVIKILWKPTWESTFLLCCSFKVACQNYSAQYCGQRWNKMGFLIRTLNLVLS